MNQNHNKRIIIYIFILFIFLITIVFVKENRTKIEVASVKVANKVEFYNPDYNKEFIKQINEFEINNKEIKNKYQFVFLSDSHLSIIDENEPDERIKNSLIERQGLFNLNKSESQNVLLESINYTNKKNANALLLVGDIIDSPAKSNINCLKKNLSQLKTDYLYTFGNHDWTFSWDYQSDETEKRYVPLFNEVMKDTDVDYLEYEDLIILAINNGKNKIEEKNIPKIKRILEKNKPTIVMMHIPIATENLIEANKIYRSDRISVLGEGGIELTESTKKAFDLILSEKYKVFYIISGHVHAKMEDSINENVFEIVSGSACSGNINLLKINN